jgi:hypothetical protein
MIDMILSTIYIERLQKESNINKYKII